MHVSITGPQSILVTIKDGPLEITVDSDDEHAGFGPLPMLAAALATCTASVLASYAETAHLEIAGAQIALGWEYASEPQRVGSYQMAIIWPAELPEGRRKALLRAAEQCTVHATLQHPPQISASVSIAGAAPSS